MIRIQLSYGNSHEHGPKLKFKEISCILINQQAGFGGDFTELRIIRAYPESSSYPNKLSVGAAPSCEIK